MWRKSISRYDKNNTTTKKTLTIMMIACTMTAMVAYSKKDNGTGSTA